MFRSLFVIAVVFSSVSFAKKPIPLMPHAPMRSSAATHKEYTVKKQSSFDFGLEAGLLNRFQPSPGHFLGMVFGFGAKANFDFPLSYRFHLIPHIGYFFEREGEASASMTTHSLLLGAQALYDLNPSSSTSFRLGVEASLVSSLRSVSIYGQNNLNPIGFDGFVGPKLQIARHLENSNELHFNIVPTYAFAHEFYLFFTVGLKFK